MCVSASRHIVKVRSANAAARKYGDAVARKVNQPRKNCCAFGSARCASRSENPRCARSNHGFERFAQIGAFIERAVKSYGQRSRQANQFLRALDIHSVALA